MDLDPSFIGMVEDRHEGGDALGVALVGDLSRTRRHDKRTLFDLFEFLQTIDVGFFVRTHGAFGFDLMVEELCRDMGVKLYADSAAHGATRKECFGWRTDDPYMLVVDTLAVMVMTRWGKPKEVFEIDPIVIDYAVQNEHPVFAYNEEGILWPWP